MRPYVVALDQGTTSSRAILFNQAGEIVSRAQHPFRQIYPQPGWVEHDPLDIWATEKRALAEAVGAAHIDPKQIAAIGITNQRETTILWDRATGQPVHNAIVWQCRRTAPLCDELKEQGRGRRSMGISRARQRSSSHCRVWMLKSMVREALEWSVTWAAPPVRFQMSQLSTVPAHSSPRSARCRAPGTWSSSHRILVPEK